MRPADRDLAHLGQMLEAAGKVTEFTRGKSRADLDTDEVLLLAITRLIEVVGEAAKGVSERFRESHPRIKWKAIAGTRDRLAHGYLEVDVDILWSIVSTDIPVLLRELDKAVHAR